MSALVTTIAALLAVPAVYAALCAAVLLFVRLPDEPHYALLEDVLLVLTAPFLAAVVGVALLRRRR